MVDERPVTIQYHLWESTKSVEYKTFLYLNESFIILWKLHLKPLELLSQIPLNVNNPSENFKIFKPMMFTKF